MWAKMTCSIMCKSQIRSLGSKCKNLPEKTGQTTGFKKGLMPCLFYQPSKNQLGGTKTHFIIPELLRKTQFLTQQNPENRIIKTSFYPHFQQFFRIKNSILINTKIKQYFVKITRIHKMQYLTSKEQNLKGKKT